MSIVTIAGLMLASLASQLPADDHVVRVEHRSGAVEARYRPAVTIRHEQVGSVAPGGRAATLRCRWSADLAVAREARTGRGIATRTIEREAALSGHRPGWCSTSRAAIADEVARRSEGIDAHVREVAREDRAVLHAELDRLHPMAADG